MSTLSALPPARAPFQLLEVNVINAQDLALLSKNMRTYAIAWVHPDRKLSTRIDNKNSNNPSWNDKFVFRVDESFLRSDTAAVMIEIYAVKWFRDVRVGTVRVLVGNLLPPQRGPSLNTGLNSGMRFVALQVRRPSGRPQGILNLGVALLDGTMKSMPLYTQPDSSAVGYRDLMGEEPNSPHHNKHLFLRRSRSERMSSVADPDYGPRQSALTFTEYGEPPLATITTTGSMWSESDVGPPPSYLAAGTTAQDLFSLPDTHKDRNMIDDWDPEKLGRIEDLRTKLQRWKTELPAKPVTERGFGSPRVRTGHKRRHTDGGAGLFSCFLGDIYGFECSVSCGVRPKKDGTLSDSDDTDFS